MKWTVHNPRFHYEDVRPEITLSSAWLGHRNFAYDLIRYMKPGTIVELGTHWGAFFFTFCQAVRDEGLHSTCYAVDTWTGDPHSGMYGEEVYQGVSQVVDQYFSPNAKLIRDTFDAALHLFLNDSINLLHIDGYHTYEQVLHDFESWLPKLAEKGVVLFHDIAVKNPGFGVYLLWEQLKTRYPYLEFEHSGGLGVLFPKGYNSSFEDVFRASKDFPAIYRT